MTLCTGDRFDKFPVTPRRRSFRVLAYRWHLAHGRHTHTHTQEDYEIFKAQMEEKADRQDAMASSLEDSQARLEEVEASVGTLAADVEISGQGVQASTFILVPLAHAS